MIVEHHNKNYMRREVIIPTPPGSAGTGRVAVVRAAGGTLLFPG
jgi:hypothetical protein